MSDPRPWKEAPGDAPDGERRAAEVISRAAEIPPRPVDVGHGWDGVLERATAPRRERWPLVAAAAVVALAVVVGLRWTQPPEALAVVAEATGTKLEQRLDGGMQLQFGRVRTSRAVDVAVVTPQVSFSTRACMFAAEVLENGTTLSVYEGEAVVRSSDGSERVLRAGESVTWPALPAIPEALEPAEPPAAAPGACDALEPGQRSGCLEKEAQGAGLTAEVALFELARLQGRSGETAQALASWRASIERFPDGVLNPEARLALLVALTREKRFAEAAEIARGFEGAYADDPRAAEVATLRAQLDWLARER